MESIDQLLLAQEAIRSVAVAHNMQATMFPTPTSSSPKNGCNMHLSLDPIPKNPDSFIAGILENIKALCALGMPSYDSYIRVTDDGAGCFIGWGTENRDLPIRRISDNHWDFRFCDATANPYLFLAALLSAGLHGMENETPLTSKDCMVLQEQLTSERLAEYGISERMPNHLRNTIDALKENDILKHSLGKALLTEYIRVKEIELKEFQGTTDAERRPRYLLFF
jgi:glutamine synthetase